jgi:hypothetical protein
MGLGETQRNYILARPRRRPPLFASSVGYNYTCNLEDGHGPRLA